MRRIVVVAGVCLIAGMAVAQEAETTEVTTMETTGVNLLGIPTWNFEDAVPLETGTVDLRLGFKWVTASFPADWDDESDDYYLEPSIVWGACEDLQLSLRMPIALGAGGDRPGNKWGWPHGDDDDCGCFGGGNWFNRGKDDCDCIHGLDGNFDIYVGGLWNFYKQTTMECFQNCMIFPLPSLALGAEFRIPTGLRSSGIDAEVRLVATTEYSNGIRSHFNGFVKYAGCGDNDVDPRDVQWGAVLGLDGPLCDGGAVRWVADYMLRSSYQDDVDPMNILELGWEWQMADAHKLGMSIQAGLDDEDDTPNFGAVITYAYSITY